MSREQQKENARAASAYLVDPEFDWHNSQVQDTQAIEEYCRMVDRKKSAASRLPVSCDISAQGPGSDSALSYSQTNLEGPYSPLKLPARDLDAAASRSQRDPGRPVSPVPSSSRSEKSPATRELKKGSHSRIPVHVLHLERTQRSLDAVLAASLRQIQDLSHTQRRILQDFSQISGRGSESDEENEAMPSSEASDWILNPEEQSAANDSPAQS
ncbi:hypothetical protein B0H11DRAFT_2237662 [Mycena galericulata]|nr:hypothetical protein B0H11DRAFT_2237662 [Mycena galericulata]